MARQHRGGDTTLAALVRRVERTARDRSNSLRQLVEEVLEGVLEDVLGEASDEVGHVDWRDLPVGPPASARSPAALVGTADPVDGMPFVAGEPVAICRRCGVGYRPASWEFVARSNNRRCVVCRKSTSVDFATVPDEGRPRGSSGEAATRPNAMVFVPDVDDTDAPLVAPTRASISNHVGRSVRLEGRVASTMPGIGSRRVVVVASGRPGAVGVRVTISRPVASRMEQAGVRLQRLVAHTVRVRGEVRAHAGWGVEVVVSDVDGISVVESDD